MLVSPGSNDLVDKKMCAEHVSRSSPNSCGANLSALLPTMTRGMSRGRDDVLSTTALLIWASSSEKAGIDGSICIGPGRAFRDWAAAAAAAAVVAAAAAAAEAEVEVEERLEDAVRARGRSGEK